MFPQPILPAVRSPAGRPAWPRRPLVVSLCAAIFLLLLGSVGAPRTLMVRAPVLIARGVASEATASNNAVKLLRTRGMLIAAYAGHVGTMVQVLLAESRDGGAHWGPLGQVSTGPVPSRLAALAADASGRLHVVWTRYDDGVGKVYYREWAGKWTAPQLRISPAGIYAGYPSLALDRFGRPQVVWYGIRQGPAPAPTRHGAIYEILYSGLDGRVWSRPTLISTGPPDSINPALASDFAGRLHAVWYQYTVHVYQLRYALRQGAWGEPEGVSRTSEDEFNPDIAVDAQGRVALAWEEHGGGSVIDYALRAGGSWSAPRAVSSGSSPARHPSVSADASGAVWIAWDTDDGQIYARRFKNGWGPQIRLAADGGNTYPSVLSDAGALDVIWTHAGPAGSSLYFARVISPP